MPIGIEVWNYVTKKQTNMFKNFILKKKQITYNPMQRNIADMESNGVYFDDVIKEILQKQREELYCEYSGLPSVKAYEENKSNK